MSDLDRLRQAHSIKEIADIIDEIATLDKLTSKEDWNAVSRHIQDVINKHPIDSKIYNSSREPARSIQEAAAGCRQFLIGLGLTKIPDIMNQTGG